MVDIFFPTGTRTRLRAETGSRNRGGIGAWPASRAAHLESSTGGGQELSGWMEAALVDGSRSH